MLNAATLRVMSLAFQTSPESSRDPSSRSKKYMGIMLRSSTTTIKTAIKVTAVDC